MTKLYVDTNIYLDYLLKRNGKTNFAEHAFKLFKRTISCEFRIVVSDHLIYELSKYVELEKTRILFLMIKKKVDKIRVEEQDKELAKQLDCHYADALHIVLAKKANAEMIITRNGSDFEHLFKTYVPEDI